MPDELAYVHAPARMKGLVYAIVLFNREHLVFQLRSR